MCVGGYARLINGLSPFGHWRPVSIEASLGLPLVPGVSAPASFRAGFEAERRNSARDARYFPNVEAAVARNMSEMAKTRRTAENIVRRHIAPVPSTLSGSEEDGARGDGAPDVSILDVVHFD
eukprot:COSAG01_NODE_2465_length_7642_cov_11.032878_9_plen_122_part_00